MIIDGFIFYNELRLLEMRLYELSPVVDKFVIVEANQTFRGNPKELTFDDNKHMFDQYADKIDHIIVDFDGFDAGDDIHYAPWNREAFQRNQIMQTKYGDDALWIISDADEILRREYIDKLRNVETATLQMTMFDYFLNLKQSEAWTINVGKELNILLHGGADKFRYFNSGHAMPYAGWHFSSLGDAHNMRNKLKSFSHWELDVPYLTNEYNIQQNINNKLDPTGAHKLELVTVDDTWPHHVMDFPEKWNDLICLD